MIDIGVERKSEGGKEYIAVLVPTKRRNPMQAQVHIQYVRRDKFAAATKADIIGQKSPAKPKNAESVAEEKGCKPKRPPKKR